MQDVASNVVAQDLGKDIIFSTANGRVSWSKGKVCLLKVHVFRVSMFVLQYMQHSEMGSYGLLDFVFVFRSTSKCLMKSHEVSLSLIESHGSMFARVEVWEGFLNIPEYDPRHASRHLVGLEALVLATHDMGHSGMKLCCANVPIVLSEMRIRMEWASDEYCMCIAQALKTWTSGGSYSLWPSLEPWQSREIMVSEFQMVFVSDGFGIFWQCSYLSDRSCSMPRFGTVEVGVVCDGLGRL